MGNSDFILVPWYKSIINPNGDVALLGFTNNRMFGGDCYDVELGNWQINSKWKLKKKYNTIISLRCLYFANNPNDFVERCFDGLGESGLLFMDFCLGEHWRFPGFHIGWKYGDTHQYAYGEDNKLWSGVWDDTFMENPHVQSFARQIKQYGYNNLKESVYREVPKVLELQVVKRYFDVTWHTLCLASPYLQLYILLCGVKK